MSTRSGKVVFGLGMLIGGAAAFLLASAYLYDRDQPIWLCATVGALTFPVLPTVWHLVGERNRRRRIAAARTPPKGSLAPGDRFLLRMLIVGAAFLGPMFYLGGTRVLRAAWDHRTWYLPASERSAVERSANLLARVPADAEGVLLVLPHRTRHERDDDAPAILAYRHDQVMGITTLDPDERDDDHVKSVADIDEQMRKFPPLAHLGKLAYVNLAKHLIAIATPGWKDMVARGGAGPRPALVDTLRTTADDAIVVLGVLPEDPTKALGIRELTGTVRQAAVNATLRLDARVVFVDAASRELALGMARTVWDTKMTEVPEPCRAPAKRLRDAVVIATDGDATTISLTASQDMLGGLLLCGLGALSGKQ